MTDSRRQQFNPDIFQHQPGTVYPWQAFDRVTVATLCWNRRDEVARTLDALFRLAGMPFDLLVVDNASTDGTGEMLQGLAAQRPEVRLVRNAKNVGRVRGIKQIQDLAPDDGLVLYLDSDIEFLSSLFLVHLQKAFHAVRVATGSADAVLGVRLVNCEEHGFRFANGTRVFEVPSQRGGAPRSSYAAAGKEAAPEDRLAERVIVGTTGFIIGGCWACPAPLLKSVPFAELYPNYLGGDDGKASEHWASLGVPMGYIENGPIARHLDWPYTEEKIALYEGLAGRRAVTDRHFLAQKLRRWLGRR